MTAVAIRSPLAGVAAAGLLALALAMPALAQSESPTCVAGEPTTELVTDGVTLTFDSDFTCSDAADTGTYSITVGVANDAASVAGATIEDIALSHATPRIGGTSPEAGDPTATGLPLTVAAGDSGSFDVTGDYSLVQTDDGGLVNLHLRASGVTDNDEAAPFVLGINVHVLAPGVVADGDGNGDGGEASGRPDWVPGPPPWVLEMFERLAAAGFPFFADGPPFGNDGDEATADEDLTDAGSGPPDWVELPPPARQGGDDDDGQEADEGNGPPDWVPAGPPEWAHGGDVEDGGPPSGVPGRP
ncbi:MAG: hypothetical protein ACRDGV_12450 [Candidatus Limnocylindria bacterium]